MDSCQACCCAKRQITMANKAKTTVTTSRDRSLFKRESWQLGLAFISLNLGIFMVNVDSSVLHIALPVLEQTFHTSLRGLQWIILGYLILITGILPTIGKLSDRVGKKKIYIIGLCCFTAGSVLCANTFTLWQLVIFRMIQAIGASMIMANAMSLVSLIFPKGQKGRALSGISSVIALATIAGPAIGGFILSLFGWRSIFWIHVPLGILAVYLSSVYLDDRHPSNQAFKPGPFDIKGSVSFLGGTASLLVLLSEGTAWGWTSHLSLFVFALTVGCWFYFLYRERKVKAPLLNLAFFKQASFLVGNIASYISFVLIMLPSIVLPLYMAHILQLSVERIGFIMAAQAIVIILISPISGWLSDKYHQTLPALIGMLLCAVSLGLMGTFHDGTSIYLLVLSLSLFGGGLGFFQVSNNLLVLGRIPPEHNGQVGSIMATVRNFGRVTGVTFAIMFYQPVTGHAGDPAIDYSAHIDRVFLFGMLLAAFNMCLVGYLFVAQRKQVQSNTIKQSQSV